MSESTYEYKDWTCFNIGDMVYLYWSGAIPEEDLEVIETIGYTPAIAVIVGIEYNREYGNYYKLKIVYEDKLREYYVAYANGYHTIHEDMMQRKARKIKTCITKTKNH
jgi:hypothetical protein